MAFTFNDLVRQEHRGLLAYLRIFVEDNAIAEDIAQEAFMIAYQQFDDLKDQEKLGPWLRRVARNLALKNLRNKHETLLDDVILDSIEAAAEKVASEPSIIDRLNACIEKLPDSSKELIKWRYENGNSCQEIADKLGRTLSWVKTSLHRIRKTLAKCSQKKIKENDNG